MRSTFCILFYVKRNAVKENGKYPVMRRITVNGINKQFSPGIEVNLNSWNVKANKVGSKSKEAIETNAALESNKASMTKIYRGLLESDKSPDPERIKNIFFGIEKEKQQATLLGLFNDHNSEYFKLIGKSNPFFNIQIQRKPTTRQFLTEQEVKKILDRQFEIKRLEYVRALFIFSCFTGMAYIDIYKLARNSITTGFDGNLWITCERRKTTLHTVYHY